MSPHAKVQAQAGEERCDNPLQYMTRWLHHSLHGMSRYLDDDGQTGLDQHDVCGGLGGISGALDGDTNVRSLQRGRVVDTIPRHTRDVTQVPQLLHDCPHDIAGNSSG